MAVLGALFGIIYGAFSGVLLGVLLFGGAAFPPFLAVFLPIVTPIANLLSALPAPLSFLI